MIETKLPCSSLRYFAPPTSALQLAEVLRAADLGQFLAALEDVLQGHRVGDLATVDQRAAGLEDAAVHRLGEMLGPQEVGDPLEGRVVGQDGAQKRLLGLVVDGWFAITVGGAFRTGKVRQVVRAVGIHGRHLMQTDRPMLRRDCGILV
jgi:hypothetical protein